MGLDRSPTGREFKVKCRICDSADTDGIVECSRCAQSFHFKCIDADETVDAPEAFCCPDCVNSETNANRAEQSDSGNAEKVDKYRKFLQGVIPKARKVGEKQSFCKNCCRWYDGYNGELCVSCEKRVTMKLPKCTSGKIASILSRCQICLNEFLSLADQTSANVCPRCTAYARTESKSDDLLENKASQKVVDPRNDARSHSSTASTKRRKQLALKKLEEQRLLQEKLNEEKAVQIEAYLEKKYEILDITDSEEDLEPEDEMQQAGLTKKWVEHQALKQESSQAVQYPPILKNPQVPHRIGWIQNPIATSGEFENYGSNWEPRQSWNNPGHSYFDSSNAMMGGRNGFDHMNARPNRQPRSNIPVTVQPIGPRLSRDQIAARSGLKELPQFDGNPEEWPLFVSHFEHSTRICAFSDDENLMRLQKCLKGKALEAVKNRLLLPSSVPGIIATLRMLFGRPEVIIGSLLNRIKTGPSPKAEKLETIINFALAVQNLCDSMITSHLQDHLSNPHLLQELVERLPVQYRMEWQRYKRTLPRYNLATFGEWLSILAQDASEASPLPSLLHNNEIRSTESNKRGYINTHTKVHLSQSDTLQLCQICNKNNHQVSQCRKFKELKRTERWNEVRKHQLCGRCLGPHKFSRCTSNAVCGITDCNKRHHTLLHNPEHVREVKREVKTSTSNGATLGECNSHEVGKSVLYMIIPVTLRGKNKLVSTHAYIDNGSGMTIMEKSLARELELAGTRESICLKWTSGTVRHESDSERVSLHISALGAENRQYRLRNARTVEVLDLPSQEINRTELTKKYPYLNNVPFHDFNAKPRILLGVDNVKLGLAREIIEGKWYEPVVVKTMLGWVVHGPMGDSNSSEYGHMSHQVMKVSCSQCECQLERDQQLHEQIGKFFSLENFGVRALTSTLESKDIQRAKRIMLDTTIRKDGRFEMGLLWKYDDFELPNSFNMAMRRLECQERKLLSQPSLMTNINNQINDFVIKGYARKLTLEEVRTESARTCYLPLFHHLDPKKPEKVRLVWDAAAKVKGMSLNSMLLTGPDNLVPLPGILQRFREKAIALGGDIQEMYHQIAIRENDQNSQRFLWRNCDTTIKPDVYVMQVMVFGTTCAPSSAQYIKNRNASEFEDKFPKAAKAIKDNHYVDDWMDCQHTIEEAIQLAKDVKYVHEQGGFNMRKFISNSPEVLSAIGENYNHKIKDLSIGTVLGTQRVLGMWWNAQIDCFTYSSKFAKLNEEMLTGIRVPTKREVLKTLMSIYDPLGLIANYLVLLKITLQDIWKAKIDWDDQITKGLYEKWNMWVKLLPKVEELNIPRLYSHKISPNKPTSIELHTFVDASEHACCAVCYLRICNAEGVECVLVGAKTKVAPLKPLLTIPRKELLAAVLGSRWAKSVVDGHTIIINKRYFWSDSRDVLCWIKSNERKYRQFVAFRVSEILELSKETEWRWVPGKLNVADKGTKWVKPPCFKLDCRWFRGPEFLWNDTSSWPQNMPIGETTQEEEVKVHLTHSIANPPSPIVPETFSTWSKMLKAQTISKRFATKLLAKARKQPFDDTVTSDELAVAENTLYRLAQFDCFHEEISMLQSVTHQFGAKGSVKRSSPIYKLSPYLEKDGLLRVRGRIDNIAGIKFDTKRPIILPRSHKITKLVVDNYHTRYFHQNHATVLNEVRQKYCIPKLRMVLKQVISDCQKCKNSKAAPIVPVMGSLPEARLAHGFRPFTHTGVDYFGPMNVIVNRRTEKRWGILFTCLTVRAIHIEIAHTMNTDSCIISIRNFISIRGTPYEFYSDNGTNLKAADKELRQEFKNMDLVRLQTEFTKSFTKWTYNPPACPSMGGSWERLIRSVKNNLKKTMPTRTPNDELLRGYLMEVANVINSRPLTYLELETDQHESLTPNHFLLGSSNGIKAPGDFPYEEKSIVKGWRRSQELTNMFWKRWIKEYLPTLTRRTKWFQKARPIEVGDVVLIIDDDNPRNYYPKGIVMEVIPDKNGQVRQATIRTYHSVVTGSATIDEFGRTKLPVIKTHQSILTRPASKIALLDVAGNREGKAVKGPNLETAKLRNREVVKPLVDPASPTGLTGGRMLRKKATLRMLRKKATLR